MPLYFPSDTHQILFVIASHIKPNTCIVPRELFQPLQSCPYLKENLDFRTTTQMWYEMSKKLWGEGGNGPLDNVQKQAYFLLSH